MATAPRKFVLVRKRPALGSTASYPALAISQNNHRFYFLTIPQEDIFPYCFVATRSADPLEGFQRNLDEKRAHDIAKYLDDSEGSIPTNIVLSAQENAELNYDASTKLVKFQREKMAFLVLDGQHRLYGYSFTKKNHRVPIAVYSGLSRQEEAALFIDINTNQRGVPAALLLDIKQVAQQESQRETALRELFDRLKDDPTSPFNGLLSASKSITGKISRVTFNRAVAPMLDSGIMVQLSLDKRYTLLRNYFTAIEGTLDDSRLFTKSAYFEAFCGIFDDVLHSSRSKFQDYKLASLQEIVEPIKNVDISSLVTKGKTKVTKAAIIPVLKQVLKSQLQVNDDMV